MKPVSSTCGLLTIVCLSMIAGPLSADPRGVRKAAQPPPPPSAPRIDCAKLENRSRLDCRGYAGERPGYVFVPGVGYVRP